jgi:teichuronic acid exporter
VSQPTEGEPGAAPISGEESSQPTLARRTITAAQWRFASAVVEGGLQFAVGVLLARLLPPEDFGLVALALVVVGLATLVADLGLGPAVVQRRDLTERHLRVAFTTSVLMGVGMAGLLVLLSPLAGVLLRHPDLPQVLRLQSLLFLFAGLGVTARAILQRALHFRQLFWASLVSDLLGYAGVAVTLALLGFGVWSLVWGALMQALLDSLLAIALTRPPLRPLFARAELRDLFGFGAGMSLNHVVNYAARNGDNLIVGRWLGAAALGLYGRAYNLMTLPLNYLGSVIYSVLFPALSEIQNDRQRLGRAYLMSVQMTSLIATPVMAGLIVAAPHLVVALYGAAWTGMVLPLQILCTAGLFRAVYHLAGAVTQASGQVYAELKRQVLYAVLVIGGGLAGTLWGIAGVAVGVTLAIVYMYFAMAALVLRLVGRSWTEYAMVQLPGLLLGSLVGAAALAARVGLERLQLTSGWIFIGILVTCMASVPLGVYLLPPQVRPVSLFEKLGSVMDRLPVSLRQAVGRVLRLSPPRAAPEIVP